MIYKFVHFSQRVQSVQTTYIANIIKGEDGGRSGPADWCRAEWWCNLHSAAAAGLTSASQRSSGGGGLCRHQTTPAPPPPAADAASFLLSGPLVVTSTRHCHHLQQPS